MSWYNINYILIVLIFKLHQSPKYNIGIALPSFVYTVTRRILVIILSNFKYHKYSDAVRTLGFKCYYPRFFISTTCGYLLDLWKYIIRYEKTVSTYKFYRRRDFKHIYIILNECGYSNIQGVLQLININGCRHKRGKMYSLNFENGFYE